MADEVRLQKRADGPVYKKTDELVVWANDDGTLHTTDEDGTDTALGAGGGGGSQPELPLDLGPGLFEVDAKGRTVATTDADADAESGLVLQIVGGPNSLDNAQELFQVKDDQGNERFGIDAEGGVAFNTSTLPFASTVTVRTDALDPGESFADVFRAGTGGVALIAITGLSATIRDALGDPIVEVDSTGKLGFFGHAPVDRPTGVAVDAAGIHAALVSLGLITA